jgi:hypothetical protein
MGNFDATVTVAANFGSPAEWTDTVGRLTVGKARVVGSAASADGVGMAAAGNGSGGNAGVLGSTAGTAASG